MIVTPRAAKVSAQAATQPHAATKSGLQTHPLNVLRLGQRMTSPNILTCARCGSSAFVTPKDANNSSVVTCQSCGASLATVSELQAAAKAAIAAGAGKVIKEKFQAAFRDLPNIAVK